MWKQSWQPRLPAGRLHRDEDGVPALISVTAQGGCSKVVLGRDEGQALARSDLIDARVAKLTSGFGRYVQVYDERVSFTRTQLTAHRACIALRREKGSVRAAVNDAQFVDSLRRTLRA